MIDADDVGRAQRSGRGIPSIRSYLIERSCGWLQLDVNSPLVEAKQRPNGYLVERSPPMKLSTWPAFVDMMVTSPK